MNWYGEKEMIGLIYHELSHGAHSIIRDQTLDIEFDTQCFYEGWVDFKGYSDVGWYLGCEFIKDISCGYSTRELAKIKMDELEALVINYFRKF
ncbi:hypothetical protein [Dethiothermospora halolimnae]|uniref:hypothetical protein n=1 Tax=Dethiothermospora halolimnae TaxID=3114390 RepID=UPI003CCB8322